MSKPEMSTSSWTIAANIFKIRRSPRSFAIPLFGRPIDDSSSSRFLLCVGFSSPSVSAAQQNSFHVLAFHTDKGEPDHIDFAKQGLAFFTELGKKNDFHFEVTTPLGRLKRVKKLKNIQLVIWLNDFPKTPDSAPRSRTT